MIEKESCIIINKKESWDDEIVVCPKCEGKGYIIHKRLADYHNNIYDKLYVQCEHCLGKGVVKMEIDIKYSPIKDENIKVVQMTKEEINKWEKN